jgi:hypothetical protein
MPFDTGTPGEGELTLTTPGLYVFFCKVHDFMLAAVIAAAAERKERLADSNSATRTIYGHPICSCTGFVAINAIRFVKLHLESPSRLSRLCKLS